MICPRCADEQIEVMAKSPVKDVWTVYQCQHCLYTWRDTEPLRRTSREHYPEAFRMTQKDIDDAPMVPSIPHCWWQISVNKKVPGRGFALPGLVILFYKTITARFPASRYQYKPDWQMSGYL